MGQLSRTLISTLVGAGSLVAQDTKPAALVDASRFRPIDVFGLEFASQPQISPNGRLIVYMRNFMDIMKDVRRQNLWIIDRAGNDHRPLTTGSRNDAWPRWSPDGRRLLYVSRAEGSAQIYVRWMDSGQTARLTQVTRSPGSLTWSPDGRWIAFSMFVPAKPKPFARMPQKPKGAAWAEAPKVITKLKYRADGAGYLEAGSRQLFVLSAEGGTPRQLTDGPYDHSSAPSWSADSKRLVFSANRHADWEHDPRNSEVYEIDIATGKVKALTHRKGPDQAPVVSPDGKLIAYTGFDDRLQGYQVTRLYVMNRDGSGRRVLTGKLDRDVRAHRWRADGKGLLFQYDDLGTTKIAFLTLTGEMAIYADDVGGTSLGRPYSGGSFSVARDSTIAYTRTDVHAPADVAFGRPGGPGRRLTRLNQDLLGHKKLGKVQEFWCESSHDKRRVQGWYVTPPGFDPADKSKKHPLLLEIHGGPFANYGPRFAAEIQLYAAAGYVVVYVNPRGSTSYGQEFGNLIHHAYPGHDYDDLMSAVQHVVAKGFVDPKRMFVTGGSGGGVLSSWIVGKTDRFRAAVVQKPVINWYSFVLTADAYNVFYKYWFPGFPWDHTDHYMKRSPLSLVGRVKTPTMLLTGEVDYRTPMSESEQFYQALKLRKVPTALVRIPGASHGIAARPSQLIAKVVHVLEWFERHGGVGENRK